MDQESGAHPERSEGAGGAGRLPAREELLARISIDPNICFGKPCIRGHRIWVSLILDLLASGLSVAEILDEYPGLEAADIYACIAYGAELARERYVDIPNVPLTAGAAGAEAGR